MGSSAIRAASLHGMEHRVDHGRAGGRCGAAKEEREAVQWRQLCGSYVAAERQRSPARAHRRQHAQAAGRVDGVAATCLIARLQTEPAEAIVAQRSQCTSLQARQHVRRGVVQWLTACARFCRPSPTCSLRLRRRARAASGRRTSGGNSGFKSGTFALNTCAGHRPAQRMQQQPEACGTVSQEAHAE